MKWTDGKKLLRCAALAGVSVAILWLAATASAQVTGGVMTGVVQDPSGAVMPGATVTVTNEGTGIKYEVHSQANGVYYIPQLPPANYSVTATATGFSTVKIGGVKVDAGATLTHDIVLQVGTTTQSVEVAGQALLVDTTSGHVGTTIEMGQVAELPLPDRNVFNLVNLVPSAIYKLGPSDNPIGTSINSANGVSVGGGRTMETSTTLDGVNNTRGTLGMQTVEIFPPVDSVQEFRVQVNNLSAEYGRSTGGVISAVTRGGTNELHGTLYEYIRNDKFDAVGWGNDKKAPLRRNNFGGSVGGRIIKNKTFFFYNYDALRQRESGAITLNVGLPEWRQGNFSTATRDAGGRAVPVVIYDPATGTGTFGSPRGTEPFAGNVIPASRLDPVALKAMGYFPDPNRTPNNPFNQTGNFQQNRLTVLDRDYHIVRIDHNLSDSTKMYARVIVAAPEFSRNQIFWNGDTDWSYENGNLNAVVNLTHLFSPTFFLDATVGVNRVASTILAGPCCGTNWGQELNMPNVPGKTFPGFQIAGGLVPISNMGPGLSRPTNFTNPEVSLNLTKVKGIHTLKFGVQSIAFGENLSLNQDGSGTYAFDGHFTAGVDSTGKVVANTGINMADFLLGRENSVNINSTPMLGARVKYYGGYFQDDLRVSRRLTLNLGVRYETQTPTSEVNNRLSNFDPYLPSPLAGTGDIPAGAMGAMTFENRNGQGKYLYNWDTNNFAPRIGFAYRLSDRGDTTIRGGFGIFYGNETPGDTASTGVLGFSRVYSASNPVPFSLRDGLPAGSLDPIPESDLTGGFGQRGTQFALGSMGFKDPNLVLTYTENINLNVQHQWKGTFFEVGYLGNLGRKVAGAGQNINLIPPQLLSATSINERFRRPYTVLTGNESTIPMQPTHWGMSEYNAMTIRVERRLSHGFGWSASFAWSKFMDNTASPNGSVGTDNSAGQQFYNRAADRSLSSNDIPRRLVLSPIYELPVGKGRHWLNHGGVTNAVLGGWQISSLATFQSGAPFGVGVLNGPRNLLGDPVAPVLRPNLVKTDLNSPAQGQPAVGVRGLQWLDPTAFATPDPFTYGDASRTLPGVFGPGMVNIDTMLAKTFAIRERYKAQFRWEMYNSTNTPVFGQPASSFGAGNFGIVVAANSRRIMQFGLKLHW